MLIGEEIILSEENEKEDELPKEFVVVVRSDEEYITIVEVNFNLCNKKVDLHKIVDTKSFPISYLYGDMVCFQVEAIEDPASKIWWR